MDNQYQDILKIFEAQLKNSMTVGLTNHEERRHKLRSLLQAIMENKEKICQAVYADFRKASFEVELTEIFPVVSEIRHALKHIKQWMKSRRGGNSLATFGAQCRLAYQPKGVSLIISPWNYPFSLCIGPLVSAIAAGNCVVIKPSEYSPNTSAMVKDLISSLVPVNEIAVIEGDIEVSQALLQLPFNHIFFTGSPAVGKIVMRDAAQNLASVTLELGGKSPAFISEDADITQAAHKIMWGKLINAGQTCIAPDYVLIPKDKLNAFVEESLQYISQAYGPPDNLYNNPDYCRIINDRHYQRLQAFVTEFSFSQCTGAEKDAETGTENQVKIIGGDSIEHERYIPPTLLINPPLDSKIMQEEIFGPILPIIPYDNRDQALTIIQSLPRPLVLYIFSSRKQTIDYMISHTHSGDVVVNDVLIHNANVKLPFGGTNNSGIGKSHGFYGFQEFSHLRSIMKQNTYSPSSMFYPPYTAKVRKLFDHVQKYI